MKPLREIAARAGLLAVALQAMSGLPAWASTGGSDDSTPRRALRRFVDSGRSGDYRAAAEVLDLGGIPPAQRAQEGPRLARQLELALDRQPWIEEHLPRVLLDTRVLEVEAWQWLGIAVALALALITALAAGALVRAVALALARRTPFDWDDRLVEAAAGPGRLLLGLGALALVLDYLRLAAPAEAVATRALRTLVVVAFTWAGTRGVAFLADLASERLGKKSGGAALAAATRIMVLRRVAGVVVVVLGGAVLLLQFEGLRAIGTSLLASAGVAGIVIGLAAQKSLGTLLAGLQISFAEPFRVGDVVVMEGEWGTVEEVTLTYVVLRVWDLRRLVIPIGRVLDSPFQNWSRAGTELLGTVVVHADYGVPVESVRGEVERFARTRPEWNGTVAQLQVTNATDRTVELRALVSAPDAVKAWDLRCALREDLIGFLQRLDGGRHLPRVRVASAPEGRAEPTGA